MKCWNTWQRDHNHGYIETKMVNHIKSPYKKEADFDIVKQLCTRLQDIKDHKSSAAVGMHLESIEQREAVQRYYAAFPALKKGEESPQQYYLPPPAWCRKTVEDNNCKIKMQSEISLVKDFSPKYKKHSSKDRRNSYHGQRKNKKRCHHYNHILDSKENLPEWVTHEGVWDMETQDPIKEFIKAIAVDEGYGTCENTVTDDIREIAEMNFRMNESKVPNWDDSLDLNSAWVITEDLKPRVKTPLEEELYAKFEAKFDRSIEALWSRDQANTPDDEYQDLPIDFQDLLSSPSDNQFYEPSAEKYSLISLTESIWSNDACEAYTGHAHDSPTTSHSMEVLHDRFKPLNLADDGYVTSQPLLVEEPFSLYSYEGIYDAMPSMGDVMRSLTAINHNKELSSFTEVLPRPHAARPPPPRVPPPAAAASTAATDDPLYSSRTHFKPIRKVSDNAPARYADGDTFDICAELEQLEYRRSASGYLYLEAEPTRRYLEYRTRSIHYGRLNLTAAQREGNDLEDREFRLKFPLLQVDCAVQTDEDERSGGGGVAAVAAVPDEREWEELLSDISAAHAQYATEATAAAVAAGGGGGGGVDRKRRHSARCRPQSPRAAARAPCSHPHAPFLHCIGSDRPLTR